MATLRESMLRLWNEEGPWAPTLGSRRGPTSLGRQQLFVKEVAPNNVVPVNRWGVYQAVRWAAGAAFQSACRSGFREGHRAGDGGGPRA